MGWGQGDLDLEDMGRGERGRRDGDVPMGERGYAWTQIVGTRGRGT